MANRLTLRILILGLLVSLCSAAAHANNLSFSFSTVPGSGNIFGLPGSTIGWGYNITNNSSTDWLATTNLIAGSFLNLDASIVPNPNVLFDFPVLAPGATATVGYATGTAGLFEITWDPSAPLGFVNSGMFTLSGDFWSGNPLTDLQAIDLGAAPDQAVAYTATVGTAPVPEPAAVLLFLTGLAGLGVVRKRSRPA